MVYLGGGTPRHPAPAQMSETPGPRLEGGRKDFGSPVDMTRECVSTLYASVAVCPLWYVVWELTVDLSAGDCSLGMVMFFVGLVCPFVPPNDVTDFDCV
jgi:hypothetical protein